MRPHSPYYDTKPLALLGYYCTILRLLPRKKSITAHSAMWEPIVQFYGHAGQSWQLWISHLFYLPSSYLAGITYLELIHT